MGLTDENGDPIPADDPRLPGPDQTAAETAKAEALKVRLAQSGVTVLDDILDTRAKVEALVQMFVPPGDETPIRRLFLHRVEAAKVRLLGEIMEDVKAQAVKARLVVPQAQVPSTIEVHRR